MLWRIIRGHVRRRTRTWSSRLGTSLTTATSTGAGSSCMSGGTDTPYLYVSWLNGPSVNPSTPPCGATGRRLCVAPYRRRTSRERMLSACFYMLLRMHAQAYAAMDTGARRSVRAGCNNRNASGRGRAGGPADRLALSLHLLLRRIILRTRTSDKYGELRPRRLKTRPSLTPGPWEYLLHPPPNPQPPEPRRLPGTLYNHHRQVPASGSHAAVLVLV